MHNMAGVAWHGPREAIIIEERRRTIMNGRRCRNNFVASTSSNSRMMTIGVFVIFLSLQGILVKGVSAAAATTQPGIHPEVQTTTTTARAPTKSNPQATHLPLSPYTTIVPQRDLKFQQQQQQQKSTTPKNSVGYVAEWEYEGVTSPAMDEVVVEEQESFGMEQVSPLREGERSSRGGGGTDLENEDNSGTYPSRRVGPGTWQDSRGSWWLFGGQGPTFSTPTASSSSTSSSSTTTDKSIHYLSDLWVYEPERGSWRLVFRPESESSPIHSSYPENLAFPHVCGSEANGHIAVFGGGGITGTTTSLKTSRQGNPTLPFTDDNVVWLFDVPINRTNQGRRIQLDSSWDESNGLWTSYICCDACLPDGNTSLEFCPRFTREPILWCGQDSLMALQLSHSTSRPNQEQKSLSPAEQKEDNDNGGEQAEEESGGPLNGDINGSTSEERNRDSNTAAAAGVKPRRTSSSRKGGNLPEEIIRLDIHSNPRASNSDDNPEKRNSGSSSLKPGIPHSSSSGSQKQQQEGINSPVSSSNSRNTLRATLWKFDLAATEWEKMPEVNVTKAAVDLIEQGDCRTVSDQYMVYILCPSKGNPLQRSVLLFDPTRPTIDLLQDSRMELNNAFRDRKVWQLGRSTLKALRTDRRMTILFLAYDKLLDLWIHDHSSNRIYPVENVWKGSSLHAFQLSPAFYKITVSFPTSAYNNPTNSISTGGDTSENSKDKNNKNNDTNSYTFYMENPRSKLFQFFDHEQLSKNHDGWTSTGRFHISIVTDKLVFLPSRDASFLINGDAHPKTTFSMTSKATTELPPPSPTATSTTQSFNSTEKVLENSTLNPSRTTSTTAAAVIQQSSSNRSSNGTSNSTATQLTSTSSSSPEPELLTTSRSLTQADAPPPPLNTPHMSTEQKLTLTSLNPPTPQQNVSQAKFNINSSSNSTETPHKTQPLEMTSTSSSTTKSSQHSMHENVNGNIIKGTSIIIDPPLTQRLGDSVNNSTHVHLRTTTSTATVVGKENSKNTNNSPPITPSSSSTSPSVPPPPPPPVSNAHFKANNKPIFTSSTKRIPKGIVKVVNGKIAESSSSSSSSGGSKTVNHLHPVRKGAGLIFEKNKSGEVVAAMQRIQKEITTPPPAQNHHQENEQGQDHDDDDSLLHETLRTNRVVSQTRWNSSSRGVREDGVVVNRPRDEALRQSSSSSTANSEEPAAVAADLGSKISRFSTDKYDNGDDDSSQVTASSSSSSSSSSGSGRSSSVNEDSSSVSRISSSSNYDSFPAASLDEDEEDGKGHRGSVAQSYGSSEMALETMTAIKSVGIHEGPGMSPSYSSMLFFAVSLSIFGVFGIVLFVRRCVKCPPRNDDSVLIKEPPPIRYSVIPDELSYHTPIV